MRVDVAIVGAGGAGLALLHHLALRGPAGLSVALVDPVDRLRGRPADRTWCFWGPAGGPVERAVHRSWDRVLVVGADRRRRVLRIAPLRYAMVRSEDYYALVDQASTGVDVRRVRSAAERVVDGPRAAVVATSGTEVEARWVFDSRPGPPRRPARTALLQHFRGAVVRAPQAVFDPALPVLMDFTTPQPPVGLSFGYCLPTDAHAALVEYTEFSPAPLEDAGYARALERYLPHVMGGAVPFAVEHTEQGVIPMTDAVLPGRVGRRVFRLGTAGGATRPSTGYTFAAMQRQAVQVAARLAAGAVPEPPRPYPRRHAWMDALVLRGLADGTLDGPTFFARLFDRNPPARVLRFLDGLTGPGAEAALMASAPRGPMLRLAAADALARARGRARR